MKQKITWKERVLQFVEAQESASFTEIQKFIVDSKFGEGTYTSEMTTDYVWCKKTKKYERQPVRRNPYRGYFCAAFSCGYYSKKQSQWIPGGYFLRGSNRLAKQEDGKYKVIREKK